MRRSLRWTAAGCVLAATFIGLGPAQAEPRRPTWHDIFPDLPKNLAARAEGPGITAGRYPPGRLRPGVYMMTTTRPGNCHFRVELAPRPRPEFSFALSLKKEETTMPRGPELRTIGDRGPGDIIAAYVISGGCAWRRVGSMQDAQAWFRPKG